MRIAVLFASLWLAGGAAAQSSSHHFDRPAGAAEAHLRVLTAQGRVYDQDFAAGQSIDFAVQRSGETLADGVHRWELYFSPQVSASLRAQALSARQRGDETVPAGWPQPIAPRAGLFHVQRGSFQPMLENEPDAGRPGAPKASEHAKDVVVPDDQIVQGSICTGFDCVNNESFGADTLRLKENNLRIHFDDTSTGAGFAAHDWRVIANDQPSGGAAYFAIENATDARVPFTIDSGALANQLFLDDGNAGFGTTTPLFDVHVQTSDTPGIRFDQTGAGGFTPQVWDVAGNEANFFIRDVTGGSLLSFRIRPGAPTSSIDISADGDVGIGTGSPVAALNVERAVDPAAEPWLLVGRASDGDPATEDRRLELDKDGNLFVSGSFTQLSSRTSKTHFVALAGDEVLARLSSLPIWTWNYLTADTGDRHIGPVAEDFYAAFGFGRSERSLAPGDVAGVALAATQALQGEIAARDQRIAELEARLARIEAALGERAEAATSR